MTLLQNLDMAGQVSLFLLAIVLAVLIALIPAVLKQAPTAADEPD